MKYLVIPLFLFISACANQNEPIPDNPQIKEISFQYLGEDEEITLESLDKKPLNKRSLTFKNISNETKSVPFYILNKDDNDPNNYFKIAINRCISVKAGQTCRVDVVFNSRGLTHLPFPGATYEARLSFNFDHEELIPLVGTAISSRSEVKSIVLEGSTAIQKDGDKYTFSDLYLKNDGTIGSVLNVLITGNFIKRIDRCSGKELKPNQKCRVQVAYNGRNGGFPSGSIQFDEQTIPVSVVDPTSNLPLGDFSAREISYMINDGVKEEILNFSNFDSISIVPAISGISFIDNKLIVDSSLLTVQDYSFKLEVNRGVEKLEKNITLKMMPKLTVGNISVNEGAFHNFTIGLESSSTINQLIFPNLENNFTIYSIRKNSAIQSLLNRVKGSTEINSSIMNLRLDTVARYNSSGILNFIISTGGKEYAYEIPYTINRDPQERPYLNYQYHSFRDNNSTQEQINALVSNINGMNESMAGWRVPILTDYSFKELYCSGERVNTYETTATYASGSQTINECLKSISDNSQSGSINVFSFSNVYSNSNRIGGIALGLEAGVVVGADQYQVTAHEVGHILGLFHTFETYWNEPLVSRNIFTEISGRIVHSGDGSPLIMYYASQPTNITPVSLPVGSKVPADWYQGLFTYNRNGADVTPFDYSGIIDDTPYDPFGTKKVSLSLTGIYSIGISNSPFSNGNLIYFYRGSQDNYNGMSSGFACNNGAYNSLSQTYSTTCETGSLPLLNSIIKNQMSYWWSVEHGEFTNGQKGRMDRVISVYPEYGERL